MRHGELGGRGDRVWLSPFRVQQVGEVVQLKRIRQSPDVDCRRYIAKVCLLSFPALTSSFLEDPFPQGCFLAENVPSNSPRRSAFDLSFVFDAAVSMVICSFGETESTDVSRRRSFLVAAGGRVGCILVFPYPDEALPSTLSVYEKPSSDENSPQKCGVPRNPAPSTASSPNSPSPYVRGNHAPES